MKDASILSSGTLNVRLAAPCQTKPNVICGCPQSLACPAAAWSVWWASVPRLPGRNKNKEPRRSGARTWNEIKMKMCAVTAQSRLF
jgi:hypothetical protein